MSAFIALGKSESDFLKLIKFYCLLLILLYFRVGFFNHISYDHALTFHIGACDYIQYYTASLFAREGNAANVYTVGSLRPIAEKITGQSLKRVAWNYPPTFLVIVLPFSLLSYGTSLFFLASHHPLSLFVHSLQNRASSTHPMVGDCLSGNLYES